MGLSLFVTFFGDGFVDFYVDWGVGVGAGVVFEADGVEDVVVDAVFFMPFPRVDT